MPSPEIEAGLELLRSGRCKTVSEAARNAGCRRPTLNEYWKAERDGTTVRNFTVKNPASEPDAPWKPEELLKAHGLDPEEWAIARVRGNRWGDPEEPNHQLRVDAVPKAQVIEPVDPREWSPPPKPKRRRLKKDEPRKVVICGDHHCPHHDPTLHKLFLRFLEDEQPDEGVLLGDLLDFSSISKHRRGKTAPAPHPNECLRAALHVLRDYRHASPNTFWTLLPGNHDDRLDHQQIDNTPDLYEVAPGGGETLEGEDDDTPAKSLRRLLYLDELGIDLISEDFNRAKYLLGRKITLRHGYLSGKNASTNMLNKITRSTVQGHTHRLRLIYKTEHDEHDPDEPTSTRVGAEAGCMAEIKDSLGYGDEEDWQQGALLAHLWPDDDFTLAPVPYVPGRLLAPSGKRYVA